MVIYLDRVLLLNGLLDYLLLTVCAALTALPVRRGRLILGGLLGGLYAAGTLAPGCAFLGEPLWQGAFGGLMCLTAFGPGRGFFRRWLVLLLLAAAFSGTVLALTELFRAPAALIGGRVYYPLGPGTLCLTGGAVWALVRWGLGRFRHQGGDIVLVTLRCGARTVRLTALRDTGNTLRDPFSGEPVMVADRSLLGELLPEFRAGDRDPAALTAALAEAHPELKPRLIPYTAVGVDRGLLAAIRPEEVTVGGNTAAMLVAFSSGGLSRGDGYRALLGGQL